MSDDPKIEAEGPQSKSPGGKAPGNGVCRDERTHQPVVKNFDMRIAADGVWYHQGSPIRRMQMVKLFATVLKRDEAGDFWLETPVEKGRIEVEDAPFVAVELRDSGNGRDQVVSLRTNIGDWVTLGPEHPLRVETRSDSGEPRPYIRVREAPGGGIEARLLRSVFYQLVALAETGPDGQEGLLGLWSRGQFFPLGPTEA